MNLFGKFVQLIHQTESMKIKTSIYTVLLSGLLLPLLFNCKKEAVKVVPTITIEAVTNITATTVTCGGTITSDGGSAITAKGMCWSSTITIPTTADSKTSDGSGSGTFTSSVTGLTPGTTYNIRGYATNTIGTAYIGQTSFKTLALAPTITTTVITSITASAASGGGNITSDGGGAITARGVCWSTTTEPTIANDKTVDNTASGNFTSTISGLTAGTTYYLRAYATNSAGTTYGSQVSFVTQQAFSGTVTDADGNTYSTITIGTQVWMTENLKTTKYNDGTTILLVPQNYADYNSTTPGYCWYKNDAATNKNIYGALYNWYAVNTGKLCPAGWHVPTNAEWATLINYLGGEGVAGGKLKETGTTHWNSPNAGANNSSGFSALPGGERFYDNNFFYLVDRGFWWSSTNNNLINAGFMYIIASESGVHNNYIWEDVRMSFSVRCLKD